MSIEKPVRISKPSKPIRPFSADQQSALDTLMNLMIPASQDGSMPAATNLDLYHDLSELPPAVRAHFERGLDWLNEQAHSTAGQTFAELSYVAATTIVDVQRTRDPAFISAFTLHTAGRYLQHDQVVTALGLEPRAHWPKGHEVPEGNWGLLDPVRKRGPIWRDV